MYILAKITIRLLCALTPCSCFVLCALAAAKINHVGRYYVAIVNGGPPQKWLYQRQLSLIVVLLRNNLCR